MTEFYKEKFNAFFAAQMQNLKKENPEQWKIKMKEGGLTAINKADMDSLLARFLSSTFGPDLLVKSNE